MLAPIDDDKIQSSDLTTEYDIIVAGGGIAGLTAGLESARLGRSTLVLTGDVLGGHLLSIERIDGYPGFPEGVAGYELCPIAQGQAAEAGAEFAMTSVDGLNPEGDIWRVATPAGEYEARAVIVAAGTALKELGVPGEERLRGKGVSHCASCDAPLLRDRPVTVIGGGDSAMQEALTLAEAASRVTILHRGESLAGQAAYRDAIDAHAKIETRAGVEVQEIMGDDTVAGILVRNGSGAVSNIVCDGVFVYIGLQPNTAFLNARLPLDVSGRIRTDPAMRTASSGLFAAGTVRSGAPGRAVASAGDGTMAAITADSYLSHGLWQDED